MLTGAASFSHDDLDLFDLLLYVLELACFKKFIQSRSITNTSRMIEQVAPQSIKRIIQL